MTETEKMGIEISKALEWDGEAIVEAFRAALEDVNFHTFNEAVGEAWELEIKRWDDEARLAIRFPDA